MATGEQHHPQEAHQGEVGAALFPTISALVHHTETSGGSTTAISGTGYQHSPVPGQDQPEAYITCDHCSAKFSRRITALKHRMAHDLNSTWFPSEGDGVHRPSKSRFLHHLRSLRALERESMPHHSYTPYTRCNSPADLNLPRRSHRPTAEVHSYTPYTRYNSPADLNLPRRSHRPTAGVNVATQEGTLAEAQPSFSAEDMSWSLSSVVKSSQDSSTGRSFDDASEIRAALSHMSKIRAALSKLRKSSQDFSTGSGLGDTSEIRAALPAVPVVLPQEYSSMELNEATGRGKYGLPEVIHGPFSGTDSSQDLSRGSGLGDMSEIRAALPAVPVVLPQEYSSMELNEATGRGKYGLPEVIHGPFSGTESSQDLSRGSGLGDMSH